MSYRIYNKSNMEYVVDSGQKFDLIFADYVYENLDFSWAMKYWDYLLPNSIFIAMTDFHSQHRFRVFMEDKLNAIFVNHLVWKNEWGNHPKDRMHQCYDDILIYSNGKNWKFYSDRIQVPKATAKTNLNPSGRMTKTATAWIDDCVLTTTSNERQKLEDGHNIRWQKPKKLLYRLFAPFVNSGDTILDPFMGSGSSGEVTIDLDCNYIGIEIDLDVFAIAKKRLDGYVKT